MRARLTCGVLVLSVDIDSAVSASTSFAYHAEIASLVEHLAEQFRGHQVCATWFSTAPGAGPGGTKIPGDGSIGELGWMAVHLSDNDRAELPRHLARGLAAHAARGLHVPCLAVPEAALDQGELLLRHSIAAVRQLPGPRDRGPWRRLLRGVSRSEPAPRGLRYGLWHLPETRRIGHPRQVRAAQRIVLCCAAQPRLAHVVLDVPSLARAGRDGRAAIDEWIRLAMVQRAAGRLTVGSMAQAAALLTCPRSVQPARSILRCAA